MSEAARRTFFARNLRRNATDAERALWRILSALRPRFSRQLPIGPYIADFACRRARLIVELDGSQHVGSHRDSIRTAELEADGWHVLRYWNNDVLENGEGVFLSIIEAGNPRLPPDEAFTFVGSRVRKKKGPPPAPPASAGGES